MEINIGSCKLDLVHGDITQQSTDAMVNAANRQLAGGGGVDGAIHRGGGPSIMAETREKYPQGCPTGEAVITGAGQLPARYVIHTVGPIWRGGKQGEPDLLASAYRRSLEVAVDHHCQSVAFPSLSTGAYGYPLDLAARTALRTVLAFLQARQQPAWVRFVLFDQGTLDTFVQTLTGLQSTQDA
jgi:O-acetyl-ADP-ribose deacetylase (regulator of RNase III)